MHFSGRLFFVFSPLFFSRSSCLSLRFDGVVGDELLGLSMDLCVVSVWPFFTGSSTPFAPRNIFSECCLSCPCFFGVLLVLARLFGKIFGSELRYKFSGANFWNPVRQYSVGHDCLPVRCWPQLLASTVSVFLFRFCLLLFSFCFSGGRLGPFFLLCASSAKVPGLPHLHQGRAACIPSLSLSFFLSSARAGARFFLSFFLSFFLYLSLSCALLHQIAVCTRAVKAWPIDPSGRFFRLKGVQLGQ